MGQHEDHAALVDSILLGYGALPYLRIWRQVTGKFLTFRRRTVVNVGIKGQADISGVLACGRRVEIEAKTGKGRRTRDQVTWARVMEENGAFYILARSCLDVERELNEHARGCVACGHRARGRTPDVGSEDNDRGRR